MKGPRTFVRRTRVRRTKNPTWLENVVLANILFLRAQELKVIHVQKYEAE